MTGVSHARLSPGLLFAYGLPGLPLAVLGLPLIVYLPPFYAELPGLGTAAVGAVLFAARIFDLVSDIAIGWASDGTRSPIGRRKPWVLMGCPLLLISAARLFMPPTAAGAGYLLLWTVLAYLGWSLIYLPYTAWGAELAADYHERSRITAAREGGFVIGTLAAIMLPALAQHLGATRQSGLAAISWFLLTALPISLGLLIRAVPEPALRKHDRPRWREGIHLLAKNRPFRRLLLAYLLNGAANGLPATLFIFFVVHVLGVPYGSAGIFLVLYFLSAIAALPVWIKIGKPLDKHRLWCLSMAWSCLVFIWVPLLGRGDWAAYGVIVVLSGVCLGVDQAIPASIQADVIDEDRVNGGGERAGLYFGLWGMATKLSFALAVGVAYALLHAAGFNAHSIHNARGALLVLSLLYGVLPVLIKICVIRMVWRFPLNRERHAQLSQSVHAESA